MTAPREEFWSLSEAMNQPIITTQKYLCPVHGEVIDYIRVKQNGPHDGDYCQVCWVEWLVTVSKKLTPIAGEPAREGPE